MRRYAWIICLGLALMAGAIVSVARRLDTYTCILFLGLTLAGGAIAFMGDRLGRYMGKRRLTICGLRPRHTALVFTVIGGMLIAVTSLATMSLLNAQVRQAVFEVGNLLHDRKELEDELLELSAQNKQLQGETLVLREEHSEAKQLARAAQAEERRFRQELKATQQRLQQASRNAEARVATLRGEVQRYNGLVREKFRQVDRLTGEMRKKEAALKDVEAQLAQATRQHKDLQARYQTELEKFRKVDASLAETQRDLRVAEGQRAQLLEEVDSLRLQVDASRNYIRRLELGRDVLQASQDELKAAHGLLLAQVKHLEEERQRLEEDRERLIRAKIEIEENYSEKDMVLQMGEELAWDVVDGREPKARIREQVAALVDRSRTVALERGAGTKDAPHLALSAVRLAQGHELFGDDAIDLVTEQISRANTGVVTQIRAKNNTLPGEQVKGLIQVWVNRLVFREGERIAHAVLDPRQPTGKVAEELIALLQSEVRSTARDRGMIPRYGTSGISSALHVGEVPLADLVAAAEQVRKQRGAAMVEILAASDLWTADSMQVSFRVGPGGVPTLGPGGSPGLTFR